VISYGTGPTLVKLDHIFLQYGGTPILRDVFAEIKEIIREGGKGQIIGILGPSGCGKTTLFRILAGLLPPTSGQVILDGLNRPAKPGDVGMVSQDYPLFPHRTVLSNLMLAATREAPKTAQDRVQGYLSEFELEDKADLYPVQLSGGQRQRIAIIQQLLCSSHFLLMDEPFSGLDMLMLEKVGQLIQKVSNMDVLNTIILTTHDITAAASVADHLWLIGRERDANGAIIPGARIVEVYDLIERGICWHPEILTSESFVDFTREVKERFRTL
jgi:ABC-type nitrate/sulfonate/bicarbonate transport system ATPase subunit